MTVGDQTALGKPIRHHAHFASRDRIEKLVNGGNLAEYGIATRFI